MKIYPDDNVQPDFTVGFEIDNIYVSLITVARILQGVNGVSDIKKRKLFSKWKYIHIRFKYQNHDCIVFEPFGDNSCYWIGPKNNEQKWDSSHLQIAFRQYQPPLLVKILGDLVTLDLKSLFKLIMPKRKNHRSN